MIEAAYAKINLFLEVTGKHDNGYHELVTVMQTVSLADTLAFSRCEGAPRMKNNCGLPDDDKNLVMRAANVFFKAYGEVFGVEITLDKRIPMAAGMGGGSADAAATLRGLNRMSGNPFSMQQLEKLAVEIGADVPFLIQGGTAICRGIGEKIERVTNRIGGFFVSAIRGEGVSTPEAFAKLDVLYQNFSSYTPRFSVEKLCHALKTGNVDAALPLFYNGFEEVILPMRPEAKRLLEELSHNGASVARMSGSGPSLFGWFPQKEAAEAAARALIEAGARTSVCQAV